MKPLHFLLASLLAPSLACRAEHAAMGGSSTSSSAERIERDVRALVACGTRHTLSADEGGRGIAAARRYLAAELERISAERHGGRLEVRSEAHRVAPAKRLPDGADVVNVLAILPGRDPKRLVVVSGHYDSIPSDVMDARSDAPGANDDASGTAVVLECARLLGGLEPRATVVFMAVAGEEQHLSGSTAQAKAWKEQGYVVEAMLTNDIVGGGRGSNGRREPDRVRLFSEGRPSAGEEVIGSDSDSSSRQLARFVEAAAEREVRGFDVDLVFRQDRFLRGGDHKPFNELGWAAVRFTEPNENYDHQHQDVRVEDGRQFGDLPEFVDYDFVARVAEANAAALSALALAPAPPTEVQLDTRKLSPHSRLQWRAVTDGTVAGYRVRLRRTDEARWSKSVDAGASSELVLENTSMDDWLFAVEAYDAEGRASLPVFPKPLR
ncbi:MAG: M20/M25/M40 family metallo-hydrolase [Planctomycetes bacterium]|nr:M20/M25/M40 family metallo-hydrolase [Planctomycetota bacterium]